MAKKRGDKGKKDEFGLTVLERRFADEYILSGNKSGSAIKAGCTRASSGVLANRMLKNVTVQAYLAPRQKQISQILTNEYDITKDRILKELAACALLDPAKMYDENGDLLPLNKMDEMTRRAIAGVDVREMLDEDGALAGYTKKVKTASKIAALELLGRHFNMWEHKDDSVKRILNIHIVTDKNQLDHPDYKVIENGQ